MFSPKKKEKKVEKREDPSETWTSLVHSAIVITDLELDEKKNILELDKFNYFKVDTHQNACLGWKILLDRF